VHDLDGGNGFKWRMTSHQTGAWVGMLPADQFGQSAIATKPVVFRGGDGGAGAGSACTFYGTDTKPKEPVFWFTPPKKMEGRVLGVAGGGGDPGVARAAVRSHFYQHSQRHELGQLAQQQQQQQQQDPTNAHALTVQRQYTERARLSFMSYKAQANPSATNAVANFLSGGRGAKRGLSDDDGNHDISDGRSNLSGGGSSGGSGGGRRERADMGLHFHGCADWQDQGNDYQRRRVHSGDTLASVGGMSMAALVPNDVLQGLHSLRQRRTQGNSGSSGGNTSLFVPFGYGHEHLAGFGTATTANPHANNSADAMVTTPSESRATTGVPVANTLLGTLHQMRCERSTHMITE
jgi:hypothetical protein